MLSYWVRNSNANKHLEKMYNKGYWMCGCDRYADYTLIKWQKKGG